MVSKSCFVDSSTQNHAEPLWNYLKKSVLDPKCAKLDQDSHFGHVRTCQGQSRRTSPCRQSGLSLFLSSRNYTFSTFINRFNNFHKIISSIEQIYDLFTKSYLVLSKFMISRYCWLNKLRNTQGKIYGTYLGNIYGIYKEYIRNIHKYLWYKMIRNISRKHRRRLRRPPHWVCVSDGYIDGYLWLYHKYLWIFLIYSLYIPCIFPRYMYVCSMYFPLCVS